MPRTRSGGARRAQATAAGAPHPPRRPRGRPRLTPEILGERLAAYCSRHGVELGAEGLPPFPSGRRETAQHREWMSLYKAHRRLAARAQAGSSESSPATGGADLDRVLRLLAGQRGRCPVCRETLAARDALLEDQDRPGPVVLHAHCRELVVLARRLGADALDRARGLAFP